MLLLECVKLHQHVNLDNISHNHPMDALEFALKTLSTTNQCASLPAFKDSKTMELEVVLLLVFKVDVHILTI
jgi:hypothetical protein